MALVKPSTQSNNCNKFPFDTSEASCNAQTACKWVDNMSPKCDDMCGRWDRALLEATDYAARNSAETKCTYATDSKCEAKWNGERKTCVPKTASATKVCTCSNGNPVPNTACTTNGANICASCKKGYYKTGNTCTACPAGHRQTSDTFAGSSCTANVCKCPNGNPVSTAACITHDAPICATCKKGYRKNGNSCTACAAGTHQNADTFAGSSCTQCLAGSYQGAQGQALCSPCGTGTFASGTGATSCDPHRGECPATGDQVEFTTPDHKTNRVCISCGTLKGMYNGQPYNGQTVNCAAKGSICNADSRCASWKKLYKDSKCTCPAPAPATRR